ncbi:thyrostimulin beta-5 subunit [Nephila pilipes]|uniref:Thyrostimulin beta-5 subunit n=1 Tax=Nephila pilipes TaxID=299642 RepID=A0A8X6MDY4_NEPPI|nr:thyrostimulin beta-5 subunit [Nephila pilipes]
MFLIEALGILLIFGTVSMESTVSLDMEKTLECHPREFTYKATQTDENGLQCWGLVTATSCWGRCDTGEIGDWRFPYKRPFHSVCMHENREAHSTLLQNCDEGVNLDIVQYEYYEALSCACYLCDSSSTSCQEIPTYSDPFKGGFPADVTKPGRIHSIEQTN